MKAAPLAILVFTIFLDLLGFGIIIPILPYLAERYGASPLVVTSLMASYSLMQVLFAPVWGSLSDRIGRRPVILVSLTVSTVGFLLLGLAQSLWMVFAARILAGLGNANLAAAQAYVADVTQPEQRARGMGLLGMAFGLGFVFGPAVGGYLGGIDVALPAFVAAAFTSLDLLLASFLLPEPARRARAERRGLVSFAAYREAAARPDIALLFALFFTSTFAFAQLESTFALFIEHRWHRPAATLQTEPPAIRVAAVRVVPEARDTAHQRAARETGAALFVVGIVAAIVQGGLIGPLTRRFGEKHLIIAGMTVEGAGMAALPTAPTLAALMGISAVIAFGNGLLIPSLYGLLSKRAADQAQGRTLGLGQSLASLARVGGPILGGILFQYRGIGAPFTVGAVLLVAAASGAMRLRRP